MIAGLRKKGTSLAAASRRTGLASSTLANALSRSWSRGEQLIADAVGISPEIILPSRYFDDRGNRTGRRQAKRGSFSVTR
ncbi:helix-turn-helix domain-containing protein [Escherichia coli]